MTSNVLSIRDISSILKIFFKTIIDDFPLEQKINLDYKTMRRKYLVIWYIYLGTKYPIGDGHNEIHFISYTADLLHNVENFELNLMMKMFKREKIINILLKHVFFFMREKIRKTSLNSTFL